MNVLGVDYGRAKFGLAISAGRVAVPLSVERVNSWEKAIAKIRKIIAAEKVDKVVIGISEGDMAKEQYRFAKLLRNVLFVPVETWDETLSTRDAQRLSAELKIPRHRRREMEDAFAAAIMLQSYLDGRN